MIHPDTEVQFINKQVGYGVVAKSFIPKGTITWVLDKFDRVITVEQYNQFSNIYKELLNTYAYKNNLGNLVLCWDNARFVNHSFNSNCLTTAYNFEFAIRDIYPGEQLTDDYGYLNVDEPFRGIDEGTKRKIVYPNDLVKYHKVWDRKLQKSFKCLSKVQQPLKELIEDNLWNHLLKIEKGEKEMDSILCNHFVKG